jgi:hypothetical protein
VKNEVKSMFNCYTHGWRHIEKQCPVCFPLRVHTTTSTNIKIIDEFGCVISEDIKITDEFGRVSEVEAGPKIIETLEKERDLRSEVERLKLSLRLPPRPICPDCGIESLTGNVHTEECIKTVQLREQLKIAVEALESIAADHLSYNDFYKLGRDEAVHDTELARWALRKIRGDK